MQEPARSSNEMAASPIANRLDCGRNIAERIEVSRLDINPIATMSDPIAKLRRPCQLSVAGAQNAKLTPKTKMQSEQIDIRSRIGTGLLSLQS
jgi:hypothetical protein